LSCLYKIYVVLLIRLDQQVAATALINALGSKQPADKWECNLQNLGSLFVAIRDMACTYRPAEDVAFHPQKLLAKIPGASSHHVATILAQDIATAPSAQKGSEDDAGSFQTVEMKTETVLAGFIVISDHNSSEERDYSSTCDMRKEKISEADHSQHRGSTAFVWDYGVQNLDSGRPKCGQVNTVGIDMGDTDIDGSRVARDDVKAQSILHLALLHEPQLLDFAFF
jgi:hypothetical protein